jgi:hypothetical protein
MRVRVALREVHDVAYRALRVAGSSSGEAELAARAVTHAEVTSGDGLTLLLDELPRVHAGRTAARLLPGPVRILDDPAGRGLLFSVPAAVEACLAGGPARLTLVPGAAWRPAVVSVAQVCAGTALARVVELDGTQRAVAGDAVAIAARDALPADLPPGLLVRVSPAEAPDEPDGVAWGAARRSGVMVDGDTWTAATSAARGYLVPES